MSHKSAKIAEWIASFQGQEWDAHYLAYFDCFNRQKFYEAHDVLEDLWLPSRGSESADFYKALIQLAGAFVHLQKNRLQPAAALFRLSRHYLSKFPNPYHGLQISEVVHLTERWEQQLHESGYCMNPLSQQSAPTLRIASTSNSR